MEEKKTALKTKVHIRYSEVIAGTTGDREQQTLSESDLGNTGTRVQKFNKMFEEAFERHCASGLYVLKSYLLHHMVEDIESFTTLYVLYSSPYEQCNHHIN